MNQTIEKILFISPSQLRKWGKSNGWASIFSGLLVIGMAIVGYLALSIVSEDAHGKFLELSQHVEELTKEHIEAIFSPLARLVKIICIMFGFSGVILMLSGMLYLKLHELNKQIQSELDNA